jgi:hypothetical protein
LHEIYGWNHCQDIEGGERGSVSSEVILGIKNVVSWDINTQFLPHKRHITSPLQSPAG